MAADKPCPQLQSSLLPSNCLDDGTLKKITLLIPINMRCPSSNLPLILKQLHKPARPTEIVTNKPTQKMKVV